MKRFTFIPGRKAMRKEEEQGERLGTDIENGYRNYPHGFYFFPHCIAYNNT